MGDRLLKGTAMARRWLREAPETPQESPKSFQEARYGIVLGSLWGLLGAILGSSWGHLGHLGAILDIFKGSSPKSLKIAPLPREILILAMKMGPSWAKLGSKLGASCDLESNVAEHGREDDKLEVRWQ